MSRHGMKGGPILRVKAWVAFGIAVAISAEVGMTLALIIRLYGHR